jgi:hypothetical protein
MAAAERAAPYGDAGPVDVRAGLDVGDGGVPVGELTLDRQELARVAAAVAVMS